MWIKHRPSWTQRFAWLLENPDVGADWGLGCRLCSQHSSSSSPWVTFSKGVSGSGVLQVKDFADHEQSEMHKLSLSRSRPPTSEPAALAPDDIDVPTAALIRLSVEVAATPLGAQGLEFERKARLAARSDPANYPQRSAIACITDESSPPSPLFCFLPGLQTSQCRFFSLGWHDLTCHNRRSQV